MLVKIVYWKWWKQKEEPARLLWILFVIWVSLEDGAFSHLSLRTCLVLQLMVRLFSKCVALNCLQVWGKVNLTNLTLSVPSFSFNIHFLWPLLSPLFSISSSLLWTLGFLGMRVVNNSAWRMDFGLHLQQEMPCSTEQCTHAEASDVSSEAEIGKAFSP